MELTVTAKLKLLPSEEDRKELLRTMEACREDCNFVSDFCFTSHELRPIRFHRELYQDIRLRFGLKAQMAEYVIKTVVARYRTVLENQKQWIKPSFAKPQLDLVWNRSVLRTGMFPFPGLSLTWRSNWSTRQPCMDSPWSRWTLPTPPSAVPYADTRRGETGTGERSVPENKGRSLRAYALPGSHKLRPLQGGVVDEEA